MEGEKVIGITTILSLLVLALAYYFSINSKLTADNELQKRLSCILDAMLQIEQSYSVGEVKIAVGYGSCMDIFVRGAYAICKENPPLKPIHHNFINSMQEFRETYAVFFSAGSAAERFVSNKTLFQELVTIARKVSSSYVAVGGNAPVMAQRFALEGASVLLAAKKDQYLMDDILPDIIVAGGEGNKETADIHLIFEYFKDESWGPYVASRSNRFIVHSDESNPTLSSSIEFAKYLKAFRPHLLVIGGLQMMDNYPYSPGERQKYMERVSQQASQLPKSTLIHFEMASFTDIDLLQDLQSHIIPFVDSLGMNEQELPNLHSLFKYSNISVVSHQNPRVAEVLDLMREIFSIRGKLQESHSGTRSLTRIHVHTLAFQVIMVDIRGQWKNTRAAATKAALVAHRHVCHKKQVEVDDSNLLMDEGFSLTANPSTGRITFDDLHPVSCWMEQTIYQICVAPVLVCTKVQQTAGGGDNISAAGLILQIGNTTVGSGSL